MKESEPKYEYGGLVAYWTDDEYPKIHVEPEDQSCGIIQSIGRIIIKAINTITKGIKNGISKNHVRGNGWTHSGATDGGIHKTVGYHIH